MNDQIIYQDRLIEISTDSILFKNYYYPSLRPRRIPMSAIEKIVTREPGFFSGKWRLHGTGDFKTWYPLDDQRPKRDTLFIVSFAHKWLRIGFTVENSEAVIKILTDKGLIFRADASSFQKGIPFKRSETNC